MKSCLAVEVITTEVDDETTVRGPRGPVVIAAGIAALAENGT